MLQSMCNVKIVGYWGESSSLPLHDHYYPLSIAIWERVWQVKIPGITVAVRSVAMDIWDSPGPVGNSGGVM